MANVSAIMVTVDPDLLLSFNITFTNGSYSMNIIVRELSEAHSIVAKIAASHNLSYDPKCVKIYTRAVTSSAYAVTNGQIVAASMHNQTKLVGDATADSLLSTENFIEFGNSKPPASNDFELNKQKLIKHVREHPQGLPRGIMQSGGLTAKERSSACRYVISVLDLSKDTSTDEVERLLIAVRAGF